MPHLTGKMKFSSIEKEAASQVKSIASQLNSILKLDSPEVDYKFIKSNCKEKDLIHFGTYILYEEFPFNSFRHGRVVLSDNKKEEEEEIEELEEDLEEEMSEEASKYPFLSTDRVKELQFDCQVLSIAFCATKERKIKGEHIIKSVEPYLVCGSKNVIVPIWIADQSISSHSLNSFYKFLLEGKRPVEAMRSAMLATREKTNKSFADWAVFSIYGYAL